MCDRWKPATSTPDTRPHCSATTTSSRGNNRCDRATTTPSTSKMIKLQYPNGGTAYKHPSDGAVIIKWRNTTGDKTVDIDLKKGSTTTSIAKNVTGKNIRENGDVLGVSVGGASSAGHEGGGGNNNGTGIGGRGYGNDNDDRTAGLKRGNDKKEKQYGYRWKDAPVGEGYKIVLTVKDGSTTYTDESDHAFAVKKNPRGNNWYDTVADEEGDVLGASTTAETQTEVVLNYLEDTLAEISVALTQ
jgi:hypothetical protein